MPNSQSERRLFRRRSLKTKVYFEDEHGDRLFYVWTRDLSLGGLFLEGELPLKSGSLILLSFNLPNHKRPLKLTGEVMRKANEGVGVRFAGLNETAKKWMQDFLGSDE